MKCAARGRFGLLPLLALAVIVSAPALAVPILDQQQTAENGGSGFGSTAFGYFSLAQTFVPGIAGLLDTVSFGLYSWETWPSDTVVTLTIAETSSGVPTLPGLGSLTVPMPTSPNGWYDFDVSTQGLFLTPGELYALVLDAVYTEDAYPAAHMRWDPDSYLAGESLLSTNGGPWGPPMGPADLQFRTYVDPDVQQAGVPEPTTLSLLLLGGLGVCSSRRRRRTR